MESDELGVIRDWYTYVEYHIKIYIIDWKKERKKYITYKNIKSDGNICVIYLKSS